MYCCQNKEPQIQKRNEDAADALKRMEELGDARKEMEKGDGEKTYRRKCSGRFEKWAVGCSSFFTSKEQSGLRVSVDKERT